MILLPHKGIQRACIKWRNLMGLLTCSTLPLHLRFRFCIEIVVVVVVYYSMSMRSPQYSFVQCNSRITWSVLSTTSVLIQVTSDFFCMVLNQFYNLRVEIRIQFTIKILTMNTTSNIQERVLFWIHLRGTIKISIDS